MKKLTSLILPQFIQWFDTDADTPPSDARDESFNMVRCIPLIGMHLACFFVLWVGVSPFAVGTAIFLYLVRMFAITAFYHRYFSHRSFKSSRFCQFLFAVLGCTAVQRGPLWWAAHHREHHRHSDDKNDVHSPHQRGFWWSHILWFTCDAHFLTKYDKVKDFSKYPELRFINRYDMLVPVLFAISILLFGKGLETWAPGLGTNGWQLLIWGFFISTVALYHATFLVNSLAHVLGKRRYQTRDQSRNNLFLALLTLGEGWHNNHHRYPGSARQGFVWWEIDVTYYLLKVMARLGIIWDLRGVPVRVVQERVKA